MPLEFVVIFQQASVPRVALPYLSSTLAFAPAHQDVSSAPYVDFFCEYKVEYQLNATGPVSIVTPADGLNYTSLGRHERFLELQQSLDPRPGSNYLVNISWSAPCASVGLYPTCVRSCEGLTPATTICSPPACFRMQVRGDCLQVVADKAE